ncbi:hypothetical protein D3C72_1698740 [compost metagenome]
MRIRLRASGILTASSILTDSSNASALFMPLCSIRTSISCSPTRMYGFREVIGSWKIIEICSARSLFSSCSGRLRMFLPLNVAVPPMRPFGASRPISAKAVCDLPEPDSPTIPNVSPARRSKFRSFTAVTSPSAVLKVTRKSLTSSRTFCCCCACGAVAVSIIVIAALLSGLSGRGHHAGHRR